MNSLYSSLIGWTIGKILRQSSSDRKNIGIEEETIMIEEGDVILNPGVINAISELYNSLNDSDLLRV